MLKIYIFISNFSSDMQKQSLCLNKLGTNHQKFNTHAVYIYNCIILNALQNFSFFFLFLHFSLSLFFFSFSQLNCQIGAKKKRKKKIPILLKEKNYNSKNYSVKIRK